MKNPFTNCKIVSFNTAPSVYTKQDYERGDARRTMSRSDLMLFLVNPRKWRDGVEKPETDATDWGSVFDCLVLDPAGFEARYAIQPETYPSGDTQKPWHNGAGFCREWNAMIEKQRKQVVSPSVIKEANIAYERLKRDSICMELINSSRSQCLITGEYVDSTTGLKIPTKSLLDLIPAQNGPFGESIADLKTSSTAEPRKWTRKVFDYDYDAQAFMHLAMYNAATGEERKEFRHIVVENTAPYQPARRILETEYLDVGAMKIRAALRLYAHCLKTGEYPSWDDGENYNGWSFVGPEDWMVKSLPSYPLPQPQLERFDVIP